MDSTHDKHQMTFKADLNVVGWLSTGILATLFLVALSLITIFAGKVEVMIPAVVTVGPLSVLFLFLLVMYSRMRYVLGESALVLTCGPIKKTIPYNKIKRVVETNFQSRPVSIGINLPGFALARANYAGRGSVQMVATRWTKNILLIETESEIYGITPKEQQAFLVALTERLK